jgi:hypothetical protein
MKWIAHSQLASAVLNAGAWMIGVVDAEQLLDCPKALVMENSSSAAIPGRRREQPESE